MEGCFKSVIVRVDFSAECVGAARYVEAFSGRFESTSPGSCGLRGRTQPRRRAAAATASPAPPFSSERSRPGKGSRVSQIPRASDLHRTGGGCRSPPRTPLLRGVHSMATIRPSVSGRLKSGQDCVALLAQVIGGVTLPTSMLPKSTTLQRKRLSGHLLLVKPRDAGYAPREDADA